MEKPIVAITMGDPAGIGPEITAKALLKPFNDCRLLVVGNAKILEERIKMFNINIKINIVSDTSNIINKKEIINCLNLDNIDLSQFNIGEIDKMCGNASIEYILKTYDLLKKKSVQAMVTCPISKEAMSKAGFLYPGHTELLSKLTKTKKYAMMLAGEKLKVVLVTTHIAINKVSTAITKEKVEEKIKLTSEFFGKFLNIKKPKIAVCGLNPHSGEAGMFGNEEIKKISPAIENMKKKGIDVSGPYPADALFYKAQHGIYDAIIVMYHDQGLIPLKMLYMDSGVNVTLGLPIIRTSPDHGTAFDIASQGIASPNSLIAAIELATNMANKTFI